MAVDLDSSKKRRMDIFLPNVSPDLASIPSRLDLQEDTTLDRGKKEDSVMGHSTTEEPLPKFLRDLENVRVQQSKQTGSSLVMQLLQLLIRLLVLVGKDGDTRKHSSYLLFN